MHMNVDSSPVGDSGCRARAVVFDVFGTLADITQKRYPFKRLWDLAGNMPVSKEEYVKIVMTTPLSLSDAARQFCPWIEGKVVRELEDDVAIETASIRLFPEVPDVLRELKARGVKVGICSNLAAPYADPFARLLPIEPDSFSWSFEVGAIKPDLRIYEHACQQLGYSGVSVLMVGDREIEDYVGPKMAGLRAVQLRRQPLHSMVESIPTLRRLVDHL